MSKVTKKSIEKDRFYVAKTKIIERFTKWDYIVLFSIMFFYSIVAFYDLGSTKAPDTPFNVEGTNSTIQLDLGESKKIQSIWAYLGDYEGRQYEITMGNSLNGTFDKLGSVKLESVFKWTQFAVIKEDETTTPLSTTKAYRYVRIKAADAQSMLMELQLFDGSGKRILPTNSNQYATLFDEQNDFDSANTFRTGTYFDEVYHARTAYELVNGLYCYENTHPPLGKELIAVGVKIFGMNPFGWRIVGTIFGIMMLPFIFLFAKRMMNKLWVSGVATTLFAFDFMHFAQTRIATIDVFGTFFIIAMFYFMFRYSQMSFYDTKLTKTWIPLALSGLCMGLGMASKWTGVYAAVGLAIFFFAILIRRYREYRYVKQFSKKEQEKEFNVHIITNFAGYTIKTLGMCLVFFVAVPGIIYTLSYIPFNDGTTDNVFVRMIHNQINMFNYHSALNATHPFSSWWYEWPIMVRPVYYYCNTLANGLKEGISGFGNPLVWWTGIPATAMAIYYMIYDYIKTKRLNRTIAFLLLAYAAQYLPWALIWITNARITFAYHYFPSVPFVVLIIVYVMYRMVGDNPKRIKYMIIYTVATVLLFALFYPVLAGHPITADFAKRLQWFSEWYLIS